MTVYGCEATASAKKGEISEEDTFNKLMQSHHRTAEKTEAREKERG